MGDCPGDRLDHNTEAPGGATGPIPGQQLQPGDTPGQDLQRGPLFRLRTRGHFKRHYAEQAAIHHDRTGHNVRRLTDCRAHRHRHGINDLAVARLLHVVPPP